MANLKQAQLTATNLLREHGLYEQGWRFAWNANKSRHGVCKFSTKRIEASMVLARVRSDEEVRQTLLHEVAHALAGHKAAHGPVWLAKARSLGYTGGTCSESTPEVRAALVEIARYVGSCTRCDVRFPKHRMAASALGKPTHVHKGCGGKISFARNSA